MNKIILISILIFASIAGFSQSAHVVTHNKLTITCDPQKGEKSFSAWGVFPEEKAEVRRIFMNLTLAYPADRPIAHWDYIDRVKLVRKGGKKAESLNLEIGRMLTPYGSNFIPGWKYTWKVDVTDFAPFLRDSVEVQYIHTGYEATSVGWDMTIDFRIDFGPAIAKMTAFSKLWEGNFQYGNPANDIEKSLAPMPVQKASGSSFGRFRIQHTGHGMDRPKGCSEFCSRWREVIFDGKVVDHRNLWKECADNALYPQGGTWVFDRGYWCPGDLQEPDVIDIPLSKPASTIDLQMEPYTARNLDQPKEQITAYFFQYSAPQHKNDVALEEIIAPTTDEAFNRFNPRAFNPIIKIRNLGKNALRTLNISYQTSGFTAKTFHWKGNLAFNQAALITIPDWIDAQPGLNTFSVTLTKPNGANDEWEGDNFLKSEFNDVPVLPTNFVIDFLTNNKPSDNSIFIISSKGDTVFSKLPGQLKAATQILDTVKLAEGSYYLMLNDSAGDGLEFWYKADAGLGKLKLKDTKGQLLHLFESDCGNGQFFAFRTRKEVQADNNNELFGVNLFPRMVKDNLTIFTSSNKTGILKARITRDGDYIEQHEFTNIKESVTELNLKHLPEGRYIMEIYLNGIHKVSRRFNKL